jgi:SAM-dependent methyltransferase
MNGVNDACVADAGGGAGTAPRTSPVGCCPLCHSRSSEDYIRVKDNTHGIPGLFNYRQCHGCSTIYQDERVVEEDLPLCYPRDYYTHSGGDVGAAGRHPGETSGRPLGSIRDDLRRAILGSVAGEPLPGFVGRLGRSMARCRFFRERAYFGLMDELLPRTPGPVRVLDVGCGSGNLMVELQRAGSIVEGIDWDPRAAAVAGAASGACVRVGDFRAVDLPLASYDMLVMHHVIEHIDDPNGALARVAELLAPGGRAVITWPNPYSLGARLLADRWFPWEAPRHLVLPPGAALCDAARRAGLCPIHCRTTPRFSAYFFAYSRDRGGSVGRRPDMRDGILSSMIGFLNLFFGNLGDETVLYLKRPQ